MFFTPKLPVQEVSLIASQLRALSDKIDASTAKIDAITANYITRQDMASLQQTIENRFMERAVADQKFDTISDRLKKIEEQLETNNTTQREHGFVTRNNLMYWILGTIGTIYATINLLLFFAVHYKP